MSRHKARNDRDPRAGQFRIRRSASKRPQIVFATWTLRVKGEAQQSGSVCESQNHERRILMSHRRMPAVASSRAGQLAAMPPLLQLRYMRLDERVFHIAHRLWCSRNALCGTIRRKNGGQVSRELRGLHGLNLRSRIQEVPR